MISTEIMVAIVKVTSGSRMIGKKLMKWVKTTSKLTQLIEEEEEKIYFSPFGKNHTLSTVDLWNSEFSDTMEAK